MLMLIQYSRQSYPSAIQLLPIATFGFLYMDEVQSVLYVLVLPHLLAGHIGQAFVSWSVCAFGPVSTNVLKTWLGYNSLGPWCWNTANPKYIQSQGGQTPRAQNWVEVPFANATHMRSCHLSQVIPIGFDHLIQRHQGNSNICWLPWNDVPCLGALMWKWLWPKLLTWKRYQDWKWNVGNQPPSLQTVPMECVEGINHHLPSMAPGFPLFRGGISPRIIRTCPTWSMLWKLFAAWSCMQ